MLKNVYIKTQKNTTLFEQCQNQIENFFETHIHVFMTAHFPSLLQGLK